MKKRMICFWGGLLLCGILAVSCGNNKELSDCVSAGELENGFAVPPDSVRISVYWYWISGNISKEGVVKDLESMKEAGIGRAFIGNIGLPPNEAPAGPVRILSGEWWEILHTALRKAGELGIEIGIFNSPGWSQAGGPWIQPGQSMRYLASTRTLVSGEGYKEIKLAKPGPDFQDVKVLAFPCAGENGRVLTDRNAAIRSNPVIANVRALIDSDPATEISLKDMTRVHFDLTSEEEFDLRSVRIDPAARPIRAIAEVQVERNGRFESVSRFLIDRTNAMVDVGFSPYAPIQITVPKTTGKTFRLTLSEITPESGIREIVFSSEPRIERFPEKTLAKMHQTPLPYWEEYQWEPQPELDDASLAVQPEKIVDLSGQLNGDILQWEVPPGEWTVMRFGMLPTGTRNGPAAPEAIGLEVDKLTTDYLQHHFDSFLGKILNRIPAEDRKTLKVMVADSYERGGQNFTDTFLSDFSARYGYDALPFLPVYEGIVVGSREISDRFLWDMRRLVADQLSYRHIGGLREIAHDHGMTLWLENYGHWGFPGEFLQYGGQSDEIAGEFWSEGTLGDIENRAASSAAHIYGKTKVSAESFTCGGDAFSRYPATMKPRGDRFFSEGINSTLLHLYISQAADPVPPGLNAPFGNEFNRINTWFPHLRFFNDYLKRTNFMLQQGVNVADVAYFIGEDAPKMTGVTDPPLPKGYQFDYINAEVILRDMTVRDGLLTLPHGTQYRLLVLPKLETMRPELLEKIKSLVEQGARILGPAPRRSPSLEHYPDADSRVQELSGSMWGDTEESSPRVIPLGDGKIFSGFSVEEALAQIGCIPDFQTDNMPVLYAHRDLGKTQVYFLTNQSDQAVSFPAKFRIEKLRPELWEPVTGAIRPLPAYENRGGHTTVPLHLQPYESVFVVFRKAAKGNGKDRLEENFPASRVLLSLSSPWEVTFDPAFRGPQAPQHWNKLSDLSGVKADSIRYYSGLIRYETKFDRDNWPEQGRIFLQAADVGVMARVLVNGQEAGGLWTPPYRLDITEYLQEGGNTVTIEVTNTWVNRLVGDWNLPPEQRKTYSFINPWNKNSPLPKSGLIGPVTIEHTVY